MKRVGKILMNVIAALVLTYALLQLDNVPVVGNAVDAFADTEAWVWFLDKLNVSGIENEEDMMANCLAVICLLISIGIVYAANRLYVRITKADSRAATPIGS
jgi:hypothetical protein